MATCSVKTSNLLHNNWLLHIRLLIKSKLYQLPMCATKKVRELREEESVSPVLTFRERLPSPLSGPHRILLPRLKEVKRLGNYRLLASQAQLLIRLVLPSAVTHAHSKHLQFSVGAE